jgi:RNA polymerase sigma factor (TIGR02999 family)
LVYNELRQLAASILAQEKPGQTLQATALVHEAYLRLLASGRRESPVSEASGVCKHPVEAIQQRANTPRSPTFANRGHFFAACAEAMRRILVEQARRKKRLRHGGGGQQRPLEDNEPAIEAPMAEVDLLALHEALEQLEEASPRCAQLVKLRYFAGFTLPEVAQMLGISQSTAEADWTYAKAWLKRAMEKT